MSEQPKKYYVRFSNIDDFDRLMEFYAQNPHDHVCDRNEALMRNLTDNGSVTLIEDETSKIVGASISYPLFQKSGDIELQKWLEIGTTRMVLNGYPGLFDVMIAMQTLRAYLVEPPEESFICKMDSALVRKMAHKLGFRPFVPTQEVIDISDITVSALLKSSAEDWYKAGPEALPVLASRMRDAIDKPYLENVKTGEKIILDFSKSKFFNVFEDEIRNLAGRDFGDPDKPDPAKSVAKNRQSWMKWYFK